MTREPDKDRAERLAAALRDNLRKRKAQARGQAEPESPSPGYEARTK